MKLIKKYSLQIEIKKNYKSKKQADMHLVEIVQNHVQMRDDLEYENQWDKLAAIRKKAENLGKDSKLVEYGHAMNEYWQYFQNSLVDFKYDRANYETT